MPGLGVGRVIMPDHPRVIEIDLPVPDAAVFLVRGEAGFRSTVLVDPRTPEDDRRSVIEEARALEASAVVDALCGSVPMPTGRRFGLIHGEGRGDDQSYPAERLRG